MLDLTDDDLISEVSRKVYVQDYAPSPVIDGVKLVTIKNFIGEEGDFSEVLRLNEQGEMTAFPGFKLAQVNRTVLFANSVKAWHLHYKQNEIWYLPPQHYLLVGLWDVRRDSPTVNTLMRIPLGGGSSQLLFIPPGVAHGSANFYHQPVNLYYFVDHQFNLQDPDEHRIPWDTKGKEFWQPVKD